MSLQAPLLLKKDETKSEPCFPENLSLYSALSFNWVTDIMDKGYRRPLQESDIFLLPESDRCAGIAKRLQRYFDDMRPSLFHALKREWLWLTVRAGLWKIVNDGSQFTGPIFMSLILKGLTDFSVGHLSCLAFCMYLSQIVGAVGEAQYFQTAMRVGMQLRSSLMGLIFQKSLRLSVDSRMHGVSGGKLTNMVSSDTESLQGFCEVMHVLWSAPVRIITSMIFLYYLLGVSALFGAAALVGMIPIQNRLVRRMTMRVKKAQQFTDERLKIVSESFHGIQLVKCYSWEEAFRAKLTGLREQELSELFGYSLIRAFNSFLISAIPVLVAVISFSVYSLLPGNPPLTAVQAFTALSLFQVLRFPLMQLPSVINSLGACRVSIDRISNFFLLPELVHSAGTAADISAAAVVSIREGLYKWPKSEFSLRVPSLEIFRGDLIVVAGHTAGGKSSLLQALLGHFPLVSGEFKNTFTSETGSIAYCAQNSWIFSASVKENVLFGESSSVDEMRYWEALRSVQFLEDLDRMDARDLTEIGERGVNLSGGQKQRLSLARAVYSTAPFVLLDDPLSALDAAVASRVFTEAIGTAMKGRTRVLVTNRLEAVIGSVSKLNPKFVFVSEGSVSHAQPFSQLLETSPAFAALVKSCASTRSGEEEQQWVSATAGQPSDVRQDESHQLEVKQIISQEDRKTGAVSQSTVMVYVAALGHFWLIVFLFAMSETARVSASIWLSGTANNTGSFIMMYVLISAAQLVFALLSQLLSAVCGNKAARQLHYRMFDTLLIAPMKFFHATPLGRILNRFSKDVSDLDKNLSPMFGMALSVSFSLISTLLLLSGTAYLTVLPMIPLSVAFYYMQGFYRASSREIKRMDNISRSPIYAHFSQVQEGIDTVLAFNKTDFVKRQNAQLIDNHIRFNLAQMSCNRWLGIRLEFFGGAIVLVTALFIALARDSLAVGLAGLALSTALQVTGGLGGVVRVGAMLENSLNSVERLYEYSIVESEKTLSEAIAPPLGWPNQGALVYTNVVAVYSTSIAQPVLNNISFEIRGGQKVGVIGRTGAGKTSLVLTIFRILEIQSGTITIDGVNIALIPLKELRKALGIIPQEPIVFEGSLRENIDPFATFSDDAILTALSAANLGTLPLNHAIVQGGNNLSAGQRQQVCLARVLLKRPKILVLDEATSSLDALTDNLVVETIRAEFKQSTVITIAHRLHTIIESDILIALDAGKIGEIGSPAQLIDKPNGLFASLVKETGPATSKYLRDRI